MGNSIMDIIGAGVQAGWKCSLERDHSYSLLKPLFIHSVYNKYMAMVVMIRQTLSNKYIVILLIPSLVRCKEVTGAF